MEGELRTAPPAHATGAVELVALAEIADDDTFRLREVGDVSDLASSVARLGQLLPVELRPLPGAAAGAPRWQVVAGFRRLAALRLLHRDDVLARLHADMSDEDAWGLALVEALLREPLSADELEALRERLRGEGTAPWAEDLVDDARVRAPIAAELRERFHAFLAGAAEGLGEPGAAAEAEREPERGPELELEAEGEAAGGDEERRAGEPEPTVEVTPEELVQDLLGRLYEINVDLAAAWDAWGELPREGREQILAQARYVFELFPLMARFRER